MRGRLHGDGWRPAAELAGPKWCADALVGHSPQRPRRACKVLLLQAALLHVLLRLRAALLVLLRQHA